MTRRWISEEALSNLPPSMTARALAGASKPKPAPARRAPRSADAPPPMLAPAAAVPAKTGMQTMQARGRLAKGQMNATEARYAEHLAQQQMVGAVLWWKFEAIKLTLAPDTTLTVDFAVMLACGSLEMHDVKGAKAIYTDDAKVKMKVAAQMFPFVFRVAFPKKKADGGGWDVEEVRA